MEESSVQGVGRSWSQAAARSADMSPSVEWSSLEPSGIFGHSGFDVATRREPAAGGRGIASPHTSTLGCEIITVLTFLTFGRVRHQATRPEPTSLPFLSFRVCWVPDFRQSLSFISRNKSHYCLLQVKLGLS